MKKRLLLTLLMLTLLPGTAWAAKTSGSCGDGVTGFDYHESNM